MQSILRLDVRGASHARKMTFTLENFPAGVRVDAEKVAEFMERRAPGRDKLSTARRETDDAMRSKLMDTLKSPKGQTQAIQALGALLDHANLMLVRNENTIQSMMTAYQEVILL